MQLNVSSLCIKIMCISRDNHKINSKTQKVKILTFTEIIWLCWADAGFLWCFYIFCVPWENKEYHKTVIVAFLTVVNFLASFLFNKKHTAITNTKNDDDDNNLIWLVMSRVKIKPNVWQKGPVWLRTSLSIQHN